MNRLSVLALALFACAACTPAMHHTTENIKYSFKKDFQNLGAHTKKHSGDFWRAMGGDYIVRAAGLTYRDTSAYHYNDVQRPKAIPPYMPMPQPGVYECQNVQYKRRYVEINGYWRVTAHPVCMDIVR